MTDRETAEAIEAAATRWMWRLDREGRSPQFDADLEAWLAGDPRRRGAFLKAEAVWTLLDQTRGHPLPTPLASRRRPPSAVRRALLFGGGALAASTVGAGVFLWRADRYQTDVGEVRRVPLKDGSVVSINTASSLEVSLHASQRTVRLAKGEAWFQVASDARRPFVVEAGSIRVRAVGTAFSVRRRSAGVDVLVTEGVVEAWAEGRPRAPIRLEAGDKAFLDENAITRTASAASSEIDRKLEWRFGKIDLAGETLGDAVADFNRYNARKLVIADPRLADERLYGIFDMDDPAAFAAAVQVSLGVGVQAGSSRIVIGRERAS